MEPPLYYSYMTPDHQNQHISYRNLRIKTWKRTKPTTASTVMTT